MKLTDAHRDRLFDLLDYRVLQIVGVAALHDHFDTLVSIADGRDTLDQIQKRFNWNMLYRIPSSARQPLIEEIYTYADDEQIDAALCHYIKYRPALLKFCERPLAHSAAGAA